VFNAAKIRVTGDKMKQKRYYRHSGYIGNLKSQTMEEIFRKNPAEVIRRSVRGMLPKNKLQERWLKNLTIINGAQNG
jgi:large subunit ribosomal protein L13